MTKNVLQIENVEAAEILDRLDRMESALSAFSTSQQLPTPPDPRKGYITRREVAALFQITLTTVHDWTRKGILQAYKVGNRVFYKQLEVENALVKKGGLYA